MAGETTLALAQGYTKKIYGEIKDVRSKTSILQRKITFEGGTKKIGDTYQQSVTLRYPNGWTYLGSNGAASATLKQPRPQVNLQASITPFNSMLEERVVYSVLLRVADEGEGAFADFATELMKGMQTSAGNRVEANMLDGGRSLGTIETVTDNTSTADLTITEATWRPGLFWALGEGATFDGFNVATKRNASGALVLAGIKAGERKITITWTGTLGSEIVAADTLWFEGATTDAGTTLYEATGLCAQARNLTGTSMGIAAGTYSNWKGNQYNVNGNLSWDIVEDAVGQLRDRGAEGKLELYIANKGFGKLNSEPKVNRSFDSSYSPEKAKMGHKSMAYFSADVGEIEVINHNFLAQSEFLLLNPEDCARVGSQDMGFGVPNTDSDYWFPIPGTPYGGIQLTVDQGTLLKKPNHAMHGYGATFT